MVSRFIEEATAAVRRLVPDIAVLIVAHLGDGNVHFIPFFGFDRWNALPARDELAQQLRRSVNDVAHRLGGTFSAEHGIGRTMLPEMAHYKSPVELEMMRIIKRGFDPANLFNPGRLLPASSQPRASETGHPLAARATPRQLNSRPTSFRKERP